MATSARIVIRTKDQTTGRRSWVVATGKKTDPAGSYYIRTCEKAGSPRYAFAGDSYDVAVAERIRTERRLRAAELGAVLVEEVAPAPAPEERHRIADVTDAHIEQQSLPDKNGDVRPAKSLKSVRSEMTAFIAWSKLTCVDELTRETMVGCRDWFLSEGKDGKPYQPDTVYNKLMTITTVLKNNPLCPTKPLFPVSEFPDRKETIPDPYTEEEFNLFVEHAAYEDALRIYAYISSGMRDQEWMHAEKADTNWDLGALYIVKKRGRFKGKTPAALREVPLNDDLLAELQLRPEGPLFPAPEGGVDGHFVRRVEEIAKRAGIKATTDKPHMVAAGMVKDDWLHRFRDTYITNQLHLHCANMAQMIQLCKRIGHADTTTLQKYFGKLKKPYEPRFPERHSKAAKVMELEKQFSAA